MLAEEPIELRTKLPHLLLDLSPEDGMQTLCTRHDIQICAVVPASARVYIPSCLAPGWLYPSGEPYMHGFFQKM